MKTENIVNEVDICERLQAYEDTGLTPDKILVLKEKYSDTFQAHLNQLLDIKDKKIAGLEAKIKELGLL